ncbi:hypothetical protein [Daejeonella sp.]|uniref:hypothetical protein n=1 Tax=Daejeonella sp. TaxID=2805397 RepID=UPI002730671C|nr:hypothetical protein [Daejeonella sp.]MDP2415745.1 hypothetical protein [Daejeonella sp.]
MNKADELKILNKIYGNQTDLKIQDHEQPDFIMSTNQLQFGVEIVEFYDSETSARLKHIPTYHDELLDRKNFRNGDEKVLKVDKIKFYKNSEFVFEDIAIISRPPTLRVIGQQFLKTLKTKNEKFKKYDESLKYINLIIYDTEENFKSIKQENFYSEFITPEIFKEIIGSPFNEVFLIANFSDGDFYLRLKAHILIARLYLYNNFIVTKYSLKAEVMATKIFSLLRLSGFDERLKLDNELNLHYAGLQFIIKDHDEGLKILIDERRMLPILEHKLTPNLNIDNSTAEIEDFLNNNTFTSSLGFPLIN